MQPLSRHAACELGELAWCWSAMAAEAGAGLQAAMQDTAIDPETGAIDMDIINTGISSSRRTLRSDLAKELRELLLRRLPAFSACILPRDCWPARRMPTHGLTHAGISLYHRLPAATA